jgi:hypothetical protein
MQAAGFEIHILQAQVEGFAEAQAGAIQQADDQRQFRVAYLCQQARHDGLRQHRRPTRGLARADDAGEPGQVQHEHLAVKEEQCAERLILRRRTHPASHGKIGQEGLHLGAAHVGGMALAMKQDIAFNPRHVCRFSALREIAQPQASPDPVKQTRRIRQQERRRGGGWHEISLSKRYCNKKQYSPLAPWVMRQSHIPVIRHFSADITLCLEKTMC